MKAPASKRAVPLPPNSKVAVCVPSNGTWRDQFGWSLAGMLLWTATAVPQLPVVFHGNSCSSIPYNRMNLIGEAINQTDATHILFLDSDMVFPRDTLCRLLVHDLDVVGAIYSNRGGTAVTATDSVETRSRSTLVVHDGEKGLRRIEAMGLGVTLIKATVFDQVPPSCFEMRWMPDLATVEGEDYSFFRAVKDAGIAVYADMDLSWEIGHLGSVPFGIGATIKDN